MSEFVDCSTCKTDCVRADGNYGYTFCDKYTHPPMTNADRIRTMSDEELAKLLCCTGWRMFEYKECLEWLKQPVEEDKHD